MTENPRLQFWKTTTRCKKTKIGSLMNSGTKSVKKNEYITKEIEALKENQIEILEMKNSIKEIKKEVASIGNRAHQVEGRISDID